MILIFVQRLLAYVVLKIRSFADREQKAAVFAAAKDLMGHKLGSGVCIEAHGESVRGTIYRCKVSGAQGNSPEEILLKWGKPSSQASFDPSDADAEGSAYRLFNEWASLLFLETLSPEIPLAPRWLAGDRSLGFFVADEAGKLSLLDLVLGADPEKAERRLLDLGGLLGRVQAVSLGKREQYESIRFGLGPRADLGKVWGTGPWLRMMVEKLRGNLANVSFEATELFYRDLEAAIAAIDDPGPFLAFTHHDLGPENLLYSSERPSLIDFEFAAFRHGLTDGAYVRMLFPTCWRVERVPRDIVLRAEAEYRSALAERCLAAQDDDLYRRALLDGCTYWLVVTLAFALERPKNRFDLKSAVHRDNRWGPTSFRQIVQGRLDSFLDAAEGAETHRAMRESCLRLRDHLSTLWRLSADPIPYFPAFRSGGSRPTPGPADRLG